MREDESQGHGPEHVRPKGELYFPGAQASQLDTTSTPETLPKPALQRQDERPALEKELAGQSLQDVAPVAFWNVPAGQLRHDEAAAMAA